MTKNMTLRLSDDRAAELDAIAQVDKVPVAGAVRQAVATTLLRGGRFRRSKSA